MEQRIIVAVGFGISATLSALQVNGMPTTRDGWLGVLGVFVVATWGKFSSSTTVLSADRDVWTQARREAETTEK